MCRFLLLLVAIFCSSSPESRAVVLQPTTVGAGLFASRATTAAAASSTTAARYPPVFLEWHKLQSTLSHVGSRIRSMEEEDLPLNNDTCQQALQEATSSSFSDSNRENNQDESTIHIIETLLWCFVLASIVLSLLQCGTYPGPKHWNVSVVLTNNNVMMCILVAALLAAYADDWWNTMASPPIVTWRALGEAYMRYLESHPITTKSLSAGVIAIMGDYCAQWIDFALHRHDLVGTGKQNIDQRTRDYTDGGPSIMSICGRYNIRRGFAVLADGVFITGPLMHLGFEVLERWMPITSGVNDDPAAATMAAIFHVVADTLVLDSFFVAFYFVSTGLLEGMSYNELRLQLKADGWSSLRASWATSVALCPIQFCFFRYLPPQLRVLSVNCIDLVWGAVQSFMSHKNRH